MRGRQQKMHRSEKNFVPGGIGLKLTGFLGWNEKPWVENRWDFRKFDLL